MPTINIENSTLTYGTHTIDLSALPAKSIESLLSKGLSHFLGNEQSSKVKAWEDKAKTDGKAPTDEAKAAKKAEFQTAAIKALLEGTVGSGAGGLRGPRKQGLEAIMAEVALEFLKVRATAKKTKLPTKAADLNPMVEAYVTKYHDQVKAEAERRMALLAMLSEEDESEGDAPEGDTPEGDEPPTDE